MAAGMGVKPLSRPAGQRHAGLTAHLRHILGSQTAQHQPATPRVINTEAIPPVIAPGIRPGGHHHHHGIPIQALRRGKQGQARPPIRPVQILDDHHRRPGTLGLPEPIEQRQTSRERPVAAVHADLPDHKERTVRTVLVARHPQHRTRRAELGRDLGDQGSLSRSRLPLDPNHPSTLAGGISDHGACCAKLGGPTDKPIPARRTGQLGHRPTIPTHLPHPRPPRPYRP